MLLKHIANKPRFFSLVVILGTQLTFSVTSFADNHPLETSHGLKRFDKNSTLSTPKDDVAVESALDIKDIKIGQNILAKAIELSELGGEIHTITGGNRSDKVTFSFYQPFQESRIEQRLDLRFDKNSGFIEEIDLRYFITSAYLSIELIRNKVLQSAVTKYGQPLTLNEVRAKTNQREGDIKFSHFISTLQDTSAATLAYFDKMGVSRNATITADAQGFALFKSGFDQCYLWPQNNYAEILSFCGFAPRAANANNRGLEFSLVNFPIKQLISEHRVESAMQLKLTL